jgi:hypothetical protein
MPKELAAPSARQQSSVPIPSSYCEATDPTRRLALVWTWDITTTYLWDVTDAARPVSVCRLDVPDPGPIRFVTATKVSVDAHNMLYELDIKTWSMQVLATWSDPSGIIEYDTTADGATAAYALWNGGDKVAFHLVSKGMDSVVMTATDIGCCGTARVEFSPSGKYLAWGGSPGNGKTAPVEVRTVDGTLVFTAQGTAWFTWAGSGDHLYFDDGTSIVRWDGGPTTNRVIDGTWAHPNAPADRMHIAFDVYVTNTPAVRVLDVLSGTWTQLPGMNSDPLFLTDRIFTHKHYRDPALPPVASAALPCNGPCAEGGCPTDWCTYDLGDRTDVRSSFYYNFSTWPRSTPARSG